jgi:hypothetical protein
MQKALIPATFLSTAFSADTNIITHENYLYVIREEGNTSAKISHLHGLFFGNETRKQQGVNSIQELVTADPTYYSSYE